MHPDEEKICHQEKYSDELCLFGDFFTHIMTNFHGFGIYIKYFLFRRRNVLQGISPFGQTENRVNNYLKIRDGSNLYLKCMKNDNYVIHMWTEFFPLKYELIKFLSINLNGNI